MCFSCLSTTVPKNQDVRWLPGKHNISMCIRPYNIFGHVGGQGAVWEIYKLLKRRWKHETTSSLWRMQPWWQQVWGAHTGSSQHTQTFLKMSVNTITDLRRFQMANNSPEQTPRVCPISVESRVPSALTAPARSTVGQHAAPAGEFLCHTRAKRKLHAAAHWAAASSQ